MFQVGNYVVYKRDVCKIEAIKENYINNADYYVLKPVTDASLTIDVPTDNQFGYLRKPIGKDELNDIVNKIPNVEIIESPNKLIEHEYKRLLNSEDHLDLIKIIKTTYKRNKERLDNDKKIGECADYYFKKAEQYLYNEFAIVLNKSLSDTRKYIIDKVSKLEN